MLERPNVTSTVRPEVLDILAHLERDLVSQGRRSEAEAVREALMALSRTGRGLLTTGQTALRLGVSIPTVKDWVRRGTLNGLDTGTRWLVSEASVERIVGLRRTLGEMDQNYGKAGELPEPARRSRRGQSGGKAAGAWPLSG